MTDRVEPSYLTCTAAQAGEFNAQNPHNYVSLNQLLEGRAQSHPTLVVASFPERVAEDKWEPVSFTYASLLSAANNVAHHYVAEGGLSHRAKHQKKDRIIALLSPSCADFVVTLFAALRLGYGLLLLAPQNTPEAIKHLCTVTACTDIICHPMLLQHVQTAVGAQSGIRIVQIAPRTVWQQSACNHPLLPLTLSAVEERDLTALVMHTSGSTGMPKPIYHPHRIWTEAMPCMPGRPAFTTTPLFHGGSADLFRSMNALSTLYLFSSTYSMTVTNVIGAMSSCPDAAAFLSVPYILKLLAEDPRGIQILRKLDLVSTGGAPLPESLGDEMVKQGVKLVSRFGSSECGFLMSSHRHYDTDHEWSWLRHSESGERTLVFEPVSDSEYELIVPETWSTRVVSNREDGSFATGDLYTKHSVIPHAWRYCGRVDDIVVMINGKKASASPIETALRASPSVSEAVVFGASRPTLGVLIVPASPRITEDDIRTCVREINAKSASYARIPDALVVLLSSDASLPKTSKGSVVRPRALAQYSSIIDEAYRHFEQGGDNLSVIGASEIKEYVRRAVQTALASCGKALGDESDDDADLFALGIDSLQAIEVRSALKRIVPPDTNLGSNVVLEHPSINQLATLIQDARLGRNVAQGLYEDTQRHYTKMIELLNIYGAFADSTENVVQNIASGPRIIVVTGTTGALGAHVLSQLVQTTSSTVVALVRADDDFQAKARVEASIQCRKLPPVDILAGFNPNATTRVIALAADLTDGIFGLDPSVYAQLSGRLLCVLHIGWPVNFALSLDSFAPILQATQNLIAFASTSSEGRFVFCSSISAASCADKDTKNNVVPEELPRTEASAAPLGYARAKWIAEHMCARAHDGPLRNRIMIARTGQLCGDTVHGVWNQGEAWPLMFASTRYTHCLPDLTEAAYWLPVDNAATLLIHIGVCEASLRRQVPVYHVVNPIATSWADITAYLEACGLAFKRVSTREWIDRLHAHEAQLDGPTRNLIAMWESKLGVSDSPEPTFDTTHMSRVSPAMSKVTAVSKDLVQKFYSSWTESGFL